MNRTILNDVQKNNSGKKFSSQNTGIQATTIQETEESPVPVSDTVGYLWNGIDILYHNAAIGFEPVTNMLTAHTYQIRYGRFLLYDSTITIFQP